MRPEQKEAILKFTKESFLGKPAITRASNAASLVPGLLLSHEAHPREKFLDPWARFMNDRGLTAVYDKNGAAVILGDKTIASYHFGDHLVVARQYRRQGIAAELVYQFRTWFPDVPPAKSRTKAAHALQKKVWERIEREARIIRSEIAASAVVDHLAYSIEASPSVLRRPR